MAPLVLVAGQTTEEIVCSVKRVADIMGEISAASQEQSAGIEQVNQAVEQMDQMTQQNAALVGQAAAESMQDQAAALAPVVSVFRLDGEEVALKPLIAEKTFFIRKREQAKTNIKGARQKPAA